MQQSLRRCPVSVLWATDQLPRLGREVQQLAHFLNNGRADQAQAYCNGSAGPAQAYGSNGAAGQVQAYGSNGAASQARACSSSAAVQGQAHGQGRPAAGPAGALAAAPPVRSATDNAAPVPAPVPAPAAPPPPPCQPPSPYPPDGPTQAGFLRMRGLPFEVTPAEVLDFFAPFGPDPSTVLVLKRRETPRRATGVGYIGFRLADDARRARLGLGGGQIGRRFVELFACSRDQYEDAREGEGRGANQVPAAQPPRNVPPRNLPPAPCGGGGYGGLLGPAGSGSGGASGRPPAPPPLPATGYIRMRGLAFDVDESDVLTFFAGHRPDPSSLVVLRKRDGRATGEGYVAFPSRDDAASALAGLDRGAIGRRFIELFVCGREKYEDALGRASG